jgi:hypothetical protein
VDGTAAVPTVHRDVFDGSPTFYRLEVRGPGRLSATDLREAPVIAAGRR